MVPNRSPTDQTASTFPARRALISLGAGVGGEVDVQLAELAADQEVPDDPADQVEPVVGRGEALGQRGDDVEDRLEGAAQALGDHRSSSRSTAACCAAATWPRTSMPGPCGGRRLGRHGLAHQRADGGGGRLAPARSGRTHPRGRRAGGRRGRRPRGRRSRRRSRPAVRPMSVMGSRRWASNPAEMSSHVGFQAATCGARTSSMPARYTSPVAPGGRGKLTVVPDGADAADLLGRAGPGVQRVLVERDVEDARVVPEDVLGAVAVVGVDVDDQHSLALVGQQWAAMATLLTRQKPIARSVVAW